MMGKDSFTRLFSVAYFIATRETTRRSDIVAYFGEKFGKSEAYEGMISRYTKNLRDRFCMRITWSSRTGYKIRYWGVLNQEVFLQHMAKTLGEVLPDNPDQIKARLVAPDVKKPARRRLSTKRVNK